MIVRHGYRLPWIAAFLAVIFFGWLGWRDGSALCAVLGIVIGVVLFVVVRVAVEVVDLVAETLLPR